MEQPIIGYKIILRKPCVEDAAFFANWYSKPEIMFDCAIMQPATFETELEIIQNPIEDRDCFTITDINGRTVGETALLRINRNRFCAEMSMIIPTPEDRRKGYGTEAAHLMLGRAFHHHNMNRIAITVVEENIKAIKYWESIGFIKEGIQEQGYYFNGEYRNFVMMRILKHEYI